MAGATGGGNVERARGGGKGESLAIEKIRVEGVGRTFGSTVALRRVDAVFEGGEVVSIEGKNGCGKSTLLGIIGGRIAPTSGQVRFEPADAGAAEVRGQVGWVAHETLCYPDLTTRENLRLASTLYGVEERRAWEEQAARFGLEAFADRPVRYQSRGQRQRSAIARALAHRPSVVLLDEPTAGLDREGVGQLLGVVREEAARGCIVVLVSHDADVVAAVANRRLVLEGGRLVAVGAR